MKAVKQGQLECYPATCAAFAGRPLADILREAAHAAGIEDWCGEPGEWAYKIWRKEQVCDVAFRYLRDKYTPWLTMDFLVHGLNSGAVGGENILPPGRGVVGFQIPHGGRHILPYADGLLHVSDTDQPDTMTLAEYVAATGFIMETIQPEPSI